MSFVSESGPVQNLQITPDARSLYISWDPPLDSNSPIHTYIVRHRRLRLGDCRLRAEQWQPLIDVPPDVTHYELTGLEPYSLYSVKVWVRTVKHKKGQMLTLNSTTLASGTSSQAVSVLYFVADIDDNS